MNSRLTLTPKVAGMNRSFKPFASMKYLLKDTKKGRLHTSPPARNDFSDDD